MNTRTASPRLGSLSVAALIALLGPAARELLTAHDVALAALLFFRAAVERFGIGRAPDAARLDAARVAGRVAVELHRRALRDGLTSAGVVDLGAGERATVRGVDVDARHVAGNVKLAVDAAVEIEASTSTMRPWSWADLAIVAHVRQLEALRAEAAGDEGGVVLITRAAS